MHDTDLPLSQHARPKHLKKSPYALDEKSSQCSREAELSKNTMLMSMLVVISRITGFIRTWAQAYALGVTVLASCYAVANNLPNQLYELVVGGMLVTAFLPVYLSVKEKEGRGAAGKYASNLVSIVLVLMGAVSILGFIFAYEAVFTQSFSARADFDVDMCAYFFRFFVIEVVLYALSSIFSGVLNAERDYFWSSAAPIFNNVVTITSFMLYAFWYQTAPELALLSLALGNPLGVLIQVLVQMPSLAKHGIHVRFYINLHDPALKDTVGIGLGSLVVMVCSFVTVSVQTSSALSVTADGASIAFYARLWYTLPYAIMAVPITTAMFTELSADKAAGNMSSYKEGVITGTSRILFFMIPCALYLVLFSIPLVRFMAAGKFTPNQIAETSMYLSCLAASLPAYAVCMYLQKICSSLRAMSFYAGSTVVASIVQVVMCLVLTPIWGLPTVALSSCVLFVLVDIACFIMLYMRLHGIGIVRIVAACVRASIFGLIGAAAAVATLYVLGVLWFLQDVHVMLGTLAVLGYLALAGGMAMLCSFGLAFVLHAPELDLLRRLRS